MRGLMMDVPLTIRAILERAALLFPAKEVVTRTPGGLHRYTYADVYARASRLANALHGLGVRRGDRVGTFAWNSYRHLELYLAVPSSGASQPGSPPIVATGSSPSATTVSALSASPATSRCGSSGNDFDPPPHPAVPSTSAAATTRLSRAARTGRRRACRCPACSGRRTGR